MKKRDEEVKRKIVNMHMPSCQIDLGKCIAQKQSVINCCKHLTNASHEIVEETANIAYAANSFISCPGNRLRRQPIIA